MESCCFVENIGCFGQIDYITPVCQQSMPSRKNK